MTARKEPEPEYIITEQDVVDVGTLLMAGGLMLTSKEVERILRSRPLPAAEVELQPIDDANIPGILKQAFKDRDAAVAAKERDRLLDKLTSELGRYVLLNQPAINFRKIVFRKIESLRGAP